MTAQELERNNLDKFVSRVNPQAKGEVWHKFSLLFLIFDLNNKPMEQYFFEWVDPRVGSGPSLGGSGRVGSRKSDPWTTLIQPMNNLVASGGATKHHPR